MSAETTTEPPVAYHLDRPSTRTPEERLDHFDQWWAKAGDPYQAAVIEAGGIPWTTDVDERRALWARRYQRPDPPAAIPLRTLAEIRGET
jgi:hypothetical protein